MNNESKLGLFVLLLSLLGTFSTQAEKLPVEHFFKNYEFTHLTLSPDGKHLAAIAPLGDTRNLVVIERATNKAKAVTRLSKTDIAGYAWANNSRLIFYLEEDGNESLGMYAVNIDGSKSRVLAEAEKGITLVPRYTRMLDRLKQDDKHILVVNNKRRARYADVYKMNLYTGRMTREVTNPGKVEHWIADHAGQVKAAIENKLGPGGKELIYSLLYRADEKAAWEPVYEGKFGEEPVYPTGFAADNKTLYVLSAQGRDKAALLTFDPQTKQFGDPIFAHDRYDVTGPVLSETQHKLLAVHYATEKPQLHYIDEAYEALHRGIDQALPDTVNRIVDWTEDESLALVYSFSDRNPGVYYLLETDPVKLTYMFSVADRFKPEQLVDLDPIEYQARDGLTIQGYLAMPKGQKTGPVPLIVNPHGGPYGVRDHWGFNREVQFLANRGYAVLQVNFRGSGGYGHRFQRDAWKQWGLKMQDDLTDAVQWAIAEGIADPERVCIYGASYGGYAAMAGITLTPELYQCAINYVGVVDLEMLHSWDTRVKHDPDGTLAAWFHQAIGNPKDAADLKRLQQTSPIQLVERIKAPLMIVHGARDPRVEINQAYSLMNALDAHDKAYIKLIKNKEGHGFRREENRLQLYKMMDEFLQRYL
ncbi:MAG: S9 family peptidase [Gammaproteobacteria bacterium]|nr:S9 family peptidase [Gammaproteobacteria bacterium]